MSIVPPGLIRVSINLLPAFRCAPCRATYNRRSAASTCALEARPLLRGLRILTLPLRAKTLLTAGLPGIRHRDAKTRKTPALVLTPNIRRCSKHHSRASQNSATFPRKEASKQRPYDVKHGASYETAARSIPQGLPPPQRTGPQARLNLSI